MTDMINVEIMMPFLKETSLLLPLLVGMEVGTAVNRSGTEEFLVISPQISPLKDSGNFANFFTESQRVLLETPKIIAISVIRDHKSFIIHHYQEFNDINIFTENVFMCMRMFIFLKIKL